MAGAMDTNINTLHIGISLALGLFLLIRDRKYARRVAQTSFSKFRPVCYITLSASRIPAHSTRYSLWRKPSIPEMMDLGKVRISRFSILTQSL